MDGRIALEKGTELCFRNRQGGTVSLTVCGEAGRGGSCIVYDASYEDNLGYRKLVRVKECYPYGLKIRRTEDGELVADARAAEAFRVERDRMREAYQRNQALFAIDSMTNTVTNTVDLYESRGTVYIVSTWLNGKTLRDYEPKSLRECVSLALATAGVLRDMHEAGYLYLDLKPENILMIRGTTEIIQLFDFDSVISTEELEKAREANDASMVRASYSRGYAALEQQTGKIRLIGRHTDVYSLGAVLFEMLWGRLPTAPEGDIMAEYAFGEGRFDPRRYRDRVFRHLTDFFHHTLASYTGDRYESMTSAMAELERIRELADERAPWVVSSGIGAPEVFCGREEETEALKRLLESGSRGKTVNLSGMGGMGKSTLVREYLRRNREQWDGVLMLRYNGESAAELLTDDRRVTVNNLRRMPEESAGEYFERKTTALRKICAEQRVLLVLDDFEPEHLNRIGELFDIGWKVLLVSRSPMPDGYCEGLRLGALDRDGLWRLFLRYAGETEGYPAAFETIADAVGGHTLAMELVARQISRSYLTPEEAAELLTKEGLAGISGNEIDYLRDGAAVRDNLIRILDRFAALNGFTEADRKIMWILRIFGEDGVRTGLLRVLGEPVSTGRVRDLEETGWIRKREGMLSLHPLMREYVETWEKDETLNAAEDVFAAGLYASLRPEGKPEDCGKQFTADGDPKTEILGVGLRFLAYTGRVSEATRKLKFRVAMDLPVEEDLLAADMMTEMLENPVYLERDMVLRAFEYRAYLLLHGLAFEEAREALGEMRGYLLLHPNAYYWACYYRALALLQHNGNLEREAGECLRNEDKAILMARMSQRPEAKALLGAALHNKAGTLMELGGDLRQCGKLLEEARKWIDEYTGENDEERYYFTCAYAMYCARTGNFSGMREYLGRAGRIVKAVPDSVLSVVEHVLDQEAPILEAAGDSEAAAERVNGAVEVLKEHKSIPACARTLVGAWRYLGWLYQAQGKYAQSENAYLEADRTRTGLTGKTPESYCPPEVAKKAAEERRNMS